MADNNQSSGISTPLDLTNYIVKQEDQYSDCGGFSDVYKCWYNESKGVREEVAVKAFRFKSTMDEDDARQRSAKMESDIRRELGIWKRLCHENVVPFLGIAYGFGRSGALSLVSSWMPNGTLHGFLVKHDHSLGVPRRLQLLLDVANGLQYLHSFHIRSIDHGDLNSNNVLIDANGTARLADFGYASLVGSIPEALSYLQLSARPGASRWAAPELVLPQEPSNRTIKSDIYSFGSISLEVLSGKQPWSEIKSDAAVVVCLSQGQCPGRPEYHKIDDQHWNFIQQCWSSAPTERPSALSVIASIQLFLSNPQPRSISPSEYGPVSVLDEPSLDPLGLFLNDGSARGFGLSQRDEPSSVDYQGSQGRTLPKDLPTTTSTDDDTPLSTGSSTDPALGNLCNHSLLLSISPTASSIPLPPHMSTLEPLVPPSGIDVPSNPSSPIDYFYTAPSSPLTDNGTDVPSNPSSPIDHLYTATSVWLAPYPDPNASPLSYMHSLVDWTLTSMASPALGSVSNSSLPFVGAVSWVGTEAAQHPSQTTVVNEQPMSPTGGPIYQCGWMNLDGTICGQEVSVATLSKHLSGSHGIKDISRNFRLTCQWGYCRRTTGMNREFIIRHIREVHLGMKRPTRRRVQALHVY